jgi:hypothetical protein
MLRCESAEAFWALSLPRTLVAPSPRPLSETRRSRTSWSQNPPSPQKPPRRTTCFRGLILAPHQATQTRFSINDFVCIADELEGGYSRQNASYSHLRIIASVISHSRIQPQRGTKDTKPRMKFFVFLCLFVATINGQSNSAGRGESVLQQLPRLCCDLCRRPANRESEEINAVEFRDQFAVKHEDMPLRAGQSDPIHPESPRPFRAFFKPRDGFIYFLLSECEESDVH